ncbi:TIGR00153 family protein [Methanolobus vulcani]|uniref:TIGR00153 family protein n=1 Tax=Methanolobus vulcani TaxID=38026 RepID=A0A7Z8KPK0_9EURY|nr:TIGR00153 family protein [Methanolobus vulcani]TQD26700.1 TIGR00153 family protein [Methanolobus vulcani]
MIKKEYIRSVLNVFASSPFKPLVMHANKGGDCVRKLNESVMAYCDGDMEKVEALNKEIDVLEHEADVIKQTVRSELSSSIMLPVNANDLLNFLKPQDSISDDAQEVAFWLTLRKFEAPFEIHEGFCELINKTLETVELYEDLVATLSELLETSFSKRDVEETLALVTKVEEMEHQVDIIEKDLVKQIFRNEDAIGALGVYHLSLLVRGIGDIADKAEHAADRLRTMVLRR